MRERGGGATREVAMATTSYVKAQDDGNDNDNNNNDNVESMAAGMPHRLL